MKKNDFAEYFQSVWQDRWPALYDALEQPPVRTSQLLFGGYSKYVMDSASCRVAAAVDAQPGDQVLDMCAAPGGKSLMLLQSPLDQLWCNEYSSARRRRLHDVIQSHVPLESQSRVRILGWDGNQFGLRYPGEFDRILLDAPCSSERHLVEQGNVKDWSLSKSQQLARRQYSLLCSALLAVRSGGVVVYSTCSISPLENDGVIFRALERKAEFFEIDSSFKAESDLEKTRFGFQILPDRANGSGPIYFSRLKRK